MRSAQLCAAVTQETGSSPPLLPSSLLQQGRFSCGNPKGRCWCLGRITFHRPLLSNSDLFLQKRIVFRHDLSECVFRHELAWLIVLMPLPDFELLVTPHPLSKSTKYMSARFQNFLRQNFTVPPSQPQASELHQFFCLNFLSTGTIGMCQPHQAYSSLS